MFRFKRKKMISNAHITMVDGNYITVEVDNPKYAKGQVIVATVSTKEKANTGKMVVVSDVVAQGRITDIRGKNITIESRENNPMVSRKAAMEARNNRTNVDMRIVR